MHSSSLIQILKTFTTEELKRFDDFVSSSFFNRKSYVTALYKHIKKFAPEFISPKLEREKVWKELYPYKNYNYGIFKNLVFDLTKLAENFLKVEYYLKDELQTGYNFLDVLKERELVKLFKTNFNVIERSVNDTYKSKKIPAENYFDFMSRLYLLKFGFSAEYDVHPKMNEELDSHFNFLISNFFVLLIKANNNSHSFYSDHNSERKANPISSFLEKADSHNMIEELLELMKTKSLTLYRVLEAYYKLYSSYMDKDSVVKYLEFKKTLEIESGFFSKSDKYILYSSLTECLADLNDFELNKSSELLDIFKMQIRDNVILNEDGFLGTAPFISIVQTACIAGDADFIENFTKKFIAKVHSEARDNLEKFSNAHLYFAKKEFEKSLEQILLVDYDLFTMKYYLKNLQMMNYYELNDYESFLSFYDSFKHFISRNKSITQKWKDGQTLFGNFLYRLFKLKQKPDLFESERLSKEVKFSKSNKKQWLLSKLSEFKGQSGSKK